MHLVCGCFNFDVTHHILPGTHPVWPITVRIDQLLLREEGKFLGGAHEFVCISPAVYGVIAIQSMGSCVVSATPGFVRYYSAV